MLYRVTVALMCLLLVCAAHAATPPRLMAVKFHADWCGSCQKMGEVMTHLQNKYDGKPVLFVTLDLTNTSSRHQAELMAARLGLAALWEAKSASTGFIAVVDTRTGAVVDTLTSDLSVKQMGRRLVAALDHQIDSGSP